MEAKKNDRVDKKFGTVQGYSVMYVKSHAAPDKAQFVVAQVAVQNKVIWNFRDEHSKDLAYFIEVDGTCCICLVSKKGELRKIILLDALQAKIGHEEKIKELKASAKEKIKSLLE